MKKLNVVLLIVVGMFLSGCAMGGNYDYRNVGVETGNGNGKVVALGVQDQRQYVIEKVKEPKYVGIMRGGYGNPWDMNTKSGLSMAEDFMQSISTSLRNKGFKVNTRIINVNDKHEQSVIKLTKSDSEKLILLTINEWYSDIWLKTELYYNLKLEVFNSDGKLLAISETKAEIKDAGELSKRFTIVMNKLFGDKKIQEALK